METTNLFVDQAVVGVLVVGAITLLLPPEITKDLWGLSFEKVVAVLLLGYVAGILYDRIGDTLFEDLEAHRRLWTALYRFDRDGARTRKVYAEDEYRAEVMREEAAASYLRYLRSRLRVARAAATLTPALVATALGIFWYDLPRHFRIDTAFAAPLVLYPVAFWTKLLRADRQHWGWFLWLVRGPRLPRTKDLADAETRKKYTDLVRWDPEARRPKGMFLLFLIRLERLVLPILIFAGWSAVVAAKYGKAYAVAVASGIPAATLLTGWIWWRILSTATNFVTTVHDLRESEKTWH